MIVELLFEMKLMPRETTREEDKKILHINSWRGIAP